MADYKEIDQNITTSAYFAGRDFHADFEVLRKEDPVHWTEGNYGRPFWSITRHADVIQVLHDVDTFSSRLGGHLPPDPEEVFKVDQYEAGYNSLPTYTDAPRHMQYRRPFNRHFTTPVVAKLTTGVRELCREIIDEVAPRGKCDLVEDVSAELPSRFVCDLMGVPPEDMGRMRRYTSVFLGSQDPDHRMEGMTASESRLLAQKEMFDYLLDLAIQRRTDPKDDLTTLIANMATDGTPWDDRDVGWWCWSMVAAGLDTTRNGFSLTMQALLENREQFEMLRADRSLLDKAVEEGLRYGCPAKHRFRVVAKDIEFGGKLLKEGDWVVAWLVSANRDETVFENPQSFDIKRNPNPHLTFGTSQGDHFCLGRNLARLEMKLLLDEVLTRLPDIDLDGPGSWLGSTNGSGLKYMPVKFTPQTDDARAQ